MSDTGQEAVGQALLICAVGIGALSAVQLSEIAVHSFNIMITALG
jgi:hypothetical protein